MARTLYKIDESRLSEMYRMKCEGQTLEQIGDHFGVSRERIRQLIKRYCDEGGHSPPPRASEFNSARLREYASALGDECWPTTYGNVVTIWNRPGTPKMYTCSTKLCGNPAHMKERTELDRFYQYVDTDGMEGCWDWTGAMSPLGYGRFSLYGEGVFAHRASYMLHIGEPPAETPWILHHCDNRACVRPEHLYAGTPKDNTADRDRRNGPAARRRLTTDDATKIRDLHSMGTSKQALADVWGVSYTTVRNIVTGITHSKPRHLHALKVRENIVNIEARHAGGESFADIARSMNIPLGTMYNTRHRMKLASAS